MDIITKRNIGILHPALRSIVTEFVTECKVVGIRIRIYNSLRSWDEQDQIYAIGRTIDTDKSVKTNAKGGESAHNFGLAFDCVEIKNKKALWKNQQWKKIAEIGKKLGLEWGGDWKFNDKPHFQKLFGYTMNQLRQMYKETGNYVKLK